jgi:RND family efflux transporter MFP subunit
MVRGVRPASLVAVVAVGLGLVGCSPGDRDQAVELRVPVTVAEVGLGSVEDAIVATGTLRAVEEISLTVNVGGLLEIARDASGRRLGEGDRVEAGQVVAVITGEDVRLAARTEATRQRFEQAQRDLDAARRLAEQGLTPENQLNQAETALAEAKLEYDRSLHAESRNRLVTPIRGVILHLARDAAGQPMASGQLVAPGFVVAQVAPVDRLIAEVDVVGSDVARVAVGQAARVRHHAFPDRRFEGRVARLAPTIDAVTRAMRVDVEVDNGGGLLRPGMFVEATVVGDRRDNVAVLPREAVAERGGKKVVFVLRGQSVDRREVTLGLGDDRVVEVLGGVAAGERIVTRGLETLADGTRVRVTGGA